MTTASYSDPSGKYATVSGAKRWSYRTPSGAATAVGKEVAAEAKDVAKSAAEAGKDAVKAGAEAVKNAAEVTKAAVEKK